jgi:hypothetical protein
MPSEQRKMARLKKGRSDLAVVAETDILLDCKATRAPKVVQKVRV